MKTPTKTPEFSDCDDARADVMDEYEKYLDDYKEEMKILKEQEIYKEGQKAERERILEMIEKRKKIHQKHFDRYEKETKKYANDKSQVEYSENQAIKEMNICDEFKELKKEVLKDSEGKMK